jgi:hypothetical protein
MVVAHLSYDGFRVRVRFRVKVRDKGARFRGLGLEG